MGIYVMQIDQQANAAQADMLARYGGDQVEVCVARRDIAAGQTISDGDLETKLWIASLLPADAVVKKEDAIGQQVGSSILQGEVVSKARFGFDAAHIEVPDGLVAVSVPARAVQAVGGALAPGMRVDVYAVGGTSTVRIAQQVPVLETCASEGTAGDTWVTLGLQPQMVAQMVSAAENLELYFVLPSERAAAEEEQKADAEAKQQEQEQQQRDQEQEQEQTKTKGSASSSTSSSADRKTSSAGSAVEGSSTQSAAKSSSGSSSSGSHSSQKDR